MAAIILIAMLVGAVAYAAQRLGLFVSIQEKFTQIQTSQGPDALVNTWADAPIPSYMPSGFFISDATDSDGLRIIEYANSAGARYTIYLYNASASAQIDTENADKQEQIKIGDSIAYLVEKDDLSTLCWSISPMLVSIEFRPEVIPLDEIAAVAESMAPPENEKER